MPPEISKVFKAVAPILFPFSKKMGPPIPSEAIISLEGFLTLTHKVNKTDEPPLLTDKGLYITLERTLRDPEQKTMPLIYIHFEDSYGHRGADYYVEQSPNIAAWNNVIDTSETVLRHNIDQLNKKYVHAKGCMYSMGGEIFPSRVI